MKIVFASAEVAPFSKTGGLGDVAGALPHALARLGHEVLVVTPLYGSVDRRRHGLQKLGARALGRGLWEKGSEDGARVAFVEDEPLFGRAGVYGEGGGEYPDNAARFGFFSRAILPVAEAVGFGPVDVLHLNDWQTGLAALFLARERGIRPGLTRSVFTIHNLGYQGIFPKEAVDELELGWDAFTPEGLEFHDRLSFMKAGLVFSDRITTVSPTYAREIQQPDQGFGLDGVLRSRASSLVGILNGVDYEQWSPWRDRHIAAAYSSQDLDGKGVCREALCRELELAPERGEIVVGVVSRFAAQKGFDLIIEGLQRILDRGVCLAILGEGEVRFEEALRSAAERNRGRMALRIGFDEGLAHRIYAGSDAFLMPSRYEPCGLSQLYSLQYGAVPIVRETGGLADTVESADGSGGTGFLFGPFTADALVDAVGRAVDAFGDRLRWREIVRRGMEKDFSWDASARRYEEVYSGLV